MIGYFTCLYIIWFCIKFFSFTDNLDDIDTEQIFIGVIVNDVLHKQHPEIM